MMDYSLEKNLGDKEGRFFYNTCKAHRTGNGHAVTIPKRWGFQDGDLIEVNIEDFSGNSVHDYKRLCKQSTVQTGLIMFLDKSWGLDLSGFLTIRVMLIGRNCPSGKGADARREQRSKDEENPVQD